VLDRQVAGQPAVALVGVRIGHGIGPLAAEGLDEPFGFADGSARVGPGSDVPEPEGAAGLGEPPGDVGGAFLAHHPPTLDALGGC
jgi:hypothetical protein